MAFRIQDEDLIDPISSHSNGTDDDDDDDDGDYREEIEGQDDEEDDGPSKSQSSDEDRKSQNVDALVSFNHMVDHIHMHVNCQIQFKLIGTPLEEDLGRWGHHFVPCTLPDAILASTGDEVIFVCTNQVDGKLVPVESAVRSTSQQLATETGHIKEERKVPSSLLLSKNSPESSQNFTRIIATFNTRFTMLLRTSPNGIRAQSKMNMFSNNQSTLKRTHAVSDAADDDFV